jgi:leucyl aminopeptidase
VEVIDTDAEGRLILMDGLAYIKKNFNPDSIIDLATLTGSVITTLGYNAAGLFSNNDALSDALQKAGDSSGERLWRLPIWDAYMEDMKSDVADISNLSSKPMAGAITAAKFLEFFIDGHTSWAHLDIAGMALQANELGNSRVATAYGIRLLNTYLESI